MSDQVVTELVIDADTSGADRYAQAMDNVAAVGQRGVNSATGLWAALGAGAIAAGAGLNSVLDQVAKVNKELADVNASAQQYGMTLEKYQSYKFAANVGGLSDSQLNDGLQRSAALLNDASRNANSLSKLFEENGLKVKQTNGQLISENQLLETAANLVKRANNPQDAIVIAQMLGFTKEWVPFLKQGANSISEIESNARAAGAIIDSETIKKAEQFDQDWRKSSTEWAANLKTAAAAVLPTIDELILRAGKIFSKENLQWATQGVTNDTLSNAGFRDDTLKIFVDTEALNKAVEEWKDGGEGFLDKFRILFPALWNAVGSVNVETPERPITPGGEGPWQEYGPWKPDGWKPPGPTTAIPSKDTGSDALSRAIEQLEKHTARTEADTKAVGLGSAALAEFRADAALTTAAQLAGTEVTQKMRDKFQDLAQDAGDAAAALEKAKVASQIQFDRDTMFLSDTDVKIAQQLKNLYGNDVPAALASTEAAAMRANAAIKQVNDIGKETFRGFATDFRSAIANGATAWQAFEQAGANALNRIADKLVSMAADNLWASAFGGTGSGGLFGLLGFGGGSSAASGGGYAMSSGLGAGTGGLSFPMFADGTDSAPGGWSIVGERGPELVNLPRGAAVTPNHAIGKMASNDNSVQVTYSPTYQVTGTGEDIESLKRQMAKDRADFESKTIAAVRNAQKARKLA